MSVINKKYRNISIVLAIVATFVLILTFSNLNSNLVRQLQGPIEGAEKVITIGNKLCIISKENQIFTWQWNDLSIWPTVAKPAAIAISPFENDKIIYTSNANQSALIISDFKGQKHINIALPFGSKCKMLTSSANGSYLVILLSKNDENKLYFINPDLELSEIFEKIDDSTNISQIAISNNGEYIAICGAKQKQAWFNIINTKSQESWADRVLTEQKNYKQYNKVAFSPDSQKLFIAEKVRFTLMYDIASGKIEKIFEIPIYKTPSNQKQNTSSIAISPNGNTLAVDTEPAGMVWFWDIATGQKIGKIHASALTVSDIAFSPDSSMLATGCLVSPEIKIFKVPTMEKQK